MGNCLKTIKKNIEKESLNYPIEMYNTPWGSLVISCEMFTPFDERKTPKEMKKLWKSFTKNKEQIPLLDDAEFIDKTLKAFDLDKPKEWPLAMVINNNVGHVLFAPYIQGRVLPLREDGFMGVTLLHGKVYPIDWNEKKEEKEGK